MKKFQDVIYNIILYFLSNLLEILKKEINIL